MAFYVGVRSDETDNAYLTLRKDVSKCVRYAARGLGRVAFSQESSHFGGEFQLLLWLVHCGVGDIV